MRKVGPWVEEPGGCGAYRALAGTDGNFVRNRVAFIEKTPRIRIRPQWDLALDGGVEDWKNWAQGPFEGDGPDDPESREWCDKALKLFGYELSP